jgi:hypothetical protein
MLLPVDMRDWLPADHLAWFLQIAPENQRFMADRMGATVRAHSVDHTPLLAMDRDARAVACRARR